MNKLVNEYLVEFERGLDPLDAMEIGKRKKELYKKYNETVGRVLVSENIKKYFNNLKYSDTVKRYLVFALLETFIFADINTIQLAFEKACGKSFKSYTATDSFKKYKKIISDKTFKKIISNVLKKHFQITVNPNL
jgi:hypothetical protein